jgi:hypothetical protein
MTSSDLETRSRSTIHLLKLSLVLGNIHAKSEYPTFIITRVIVYNAKLGQWPSVIVKVSQGQPQGNKIRSMDYKIFLPNYIEIHMVVFFSEPHSQDPYATKSGQWPITTLK